MASLHVTRGSHWSSSGSGRSPLQKDNKDSLSESQAGLIASLTMSTPHGLSEYSTFLPQGPPPESANKVPPPPAKGSASSSKPAPSSKGVSNTFVDMLKTMELPPLVDLPDTLGGVAMDVDASAVTLHLPDGVDFDDLNSSMSMDASASHGHSQGRAADRDGLKPKATGRAYTKSPLMTSTNTPVNGTPPTANYSNTFRPHGHPTHITVSSSRSSGPLVKAYQTAGTLHRRLAESMDSQVASSKASKECAEYACLHYAAGLVYYVYAYVSQGAVERVSFYKDMKGTFGYLKVFATNNNQTLLGGLLARLDAVLLFKDLNYRAATIEKDSQSVLAAPDKADAAETTKHLREAIEILRAPAKVMARWREAEDLCAHLQDGFPGTFSKGIDLQLCTPIADAVRSVRDALSEYAHDRKLTFAFVQPRTSDAHGQVEVTVPDKVTPLPPWYKTP